MSAGLDTKSKPMHIYVAGPYSGNTTEKVEGNVTTAIMAAIELLNKGHYPYVPHLTHFVDKVEQTTLALLWEDHLDWGLAWLDKCDALLYIGKSRGADIELEYALSKRKKVFRDISEVPSIGSRRHYLKQLGIPVD